MLLARLPRQLDRLCVVRRRLDRRLGAFGDAGKRHFEKIEATMQVSDGVGLAHLLLRPSVLLHRELCGPKVEGIGDGGLLTRAGRLGTRTG